MKKQEKKEAYIKAVKNSNTAEEQKKVSEIVKILEKSLDANHFLNTRFNRQNIALCEQLMKKQESGNSDQPSEKFDNRNPFMNNK